MSEELCYHSTSVDFKICLRARKVSGPIEKRAPVLSSTGILKKAIRVGVMSKTTTLRVHQAFLYISLPSLQNYDVNFTFYGGRKQRATNFSFSLLT